MLNTIKRLEVRIQELQDQLYGLMSSQAEGGAGAQLRFGELSLEVQAIRPPAHHLPPSLFYIPQAVLNWSPDEEMPPQLRLHLWVSLRDLLHIWLSLLALNFPTPQLASLHSQSVAVRPRSLYTTSPAAHHVPFT